MRSLREALAGLAPRVAPPWPVESVEDHGRCPHNALEATVTVGREQRGTGSVQDHRAKVTVHCTDCGEFFQWLGVPDGEPDRHRPTCADNGLTLHVPMRPASEDPTVGGGW